MAQRAKSRKTGRAGRAAKKQASPTGRKGPAGRKAAKGRKATATKAAKAPRSATARKKGAARKTTAAGKRAPARAKTTPRRAPTRTAKALTALKAASTPKRLKSAMAATAATAAAAAAAVKVARASRAAAAPAVPPAPKRAPAELASRPRAATPGPRPRTVEPIASSAAGTPPRPQPRTGAAPKSRAAQPERRLPPWMADHIERYLRTNGADGHIWRGVPTLLLTTTGRRSGEPRLLPLIYGKDGDRYLVVASKGGAADHPAWYKNLVVHPQVDVQVGADKFRGRARTANRDERPRLWRTMTKIWPDYDKYQATTQREIPVVVIERA